MIEEAAFVQLECMELLLRGERWAEATMIARTNRQDVRANGAAGLTRGGADVSP